MAETTKPRKAADSPPAGPGGAGPVGLAGMTAQNPESVPANTRQAGVLVQSPAAVDVSSSTLDRRLIPVPLYDEAQAKSRAAAYEKYGGDVEKLDDETAILPEGYGAKVVVLHTGISGPGGGPYMFGQVINESHLLGDKIMGDENLLNAHMRRYVQLGAVRLANKKEESMNFVSFPQGEVAANAALVDAEARLADREAEVERLKAELAAAQKAPPAGENVASVTPTSGDAGNKDTTVAGNKDTK